jgi:hypothetical protein
MIWRLFVEAGTSELQRLTMVQPRPFRALLIAGTARNDNLESLCLRETTHPMLSIAEFFT